MVCSSLCIGLYMILYNSFLYDPKSPLYRDGVFSPLVSNRLFQWSRNIGTLCSIFIHKMKNNNKNSWLISGVKIFYSIYVVNF